MCTRINLRFHFFVCVFITAVPITQLFAWGEGDSGGHDMPMKLMKQNKGWRPLGRLFAS